MVLEYAKRRKRRRLRRKKKKEIQEVKEWFVCTKQPQGIASPIIISVEESLVHRARGEKPFSKNNASSEAMVETKPRPPGCR